MALHGPVLLSDDDAKDETLDEIQTSRIMTAQKKVTVKEAETVALGALSYLAADDERLARFLETTGLRPDTLRAAASSAGFLVAVLDYVAHDEPLLLGLSAFLQTKPKSIMAARWTLSPSEFE